MTHDLIAPFLVQIGLTFVVMFWLAYTRFTVLGKKGGMKYVMENGFPRRAINASDNFKNQFEIPVLFYAVTLLMIMGDTNSKVAVIAAWVFVAARLFHAVVHLGPNKVFPYRFLSFLLSALCVVVMTAIAFVDLVNL